MRKAHDHHQQTAIRGLPLRRYIVTLVVASVTFMLIAMAQEKEVFLPLIGLGEPPGPKVVIGKAAMEGAKRAQALVARFNRQVAAAYQKGNTRALIAPDTLKKAIQTDIAFSRQRHEPPAALERQSFVSVEPTPGGGWTLLTDETWTWPASPGRPEGRSRLRFRYTLAPQQGGGLALNKMTPVLPEPNVARAR